MDTQRCSTCNGEGRVCAHGAPLSQCPGLPGDQYTDESRCTHRPGHVGTCDDCDGRGWIVPRLKVQAVQVSLDDERSHESIESYMNDGFEPFAATDFHIWLRRAVPA